MEHGPACNQHFQRRDHFEQMRNRGSCSIDLLEVIQNQDRGSGLQRGYQCFDWPACGHGPAHRLQNGFRYMAGRPAFVKWNPTVSGEAAANLQRQPRFAAASRAGEGDEAVRLQ